MQTAANHREFALNIPEHRKANDRLDWQILQLLRPSGHGRATSKEDQTGEEIYAPHRERAVLNRIARRNPGPITSESLRHFTARSCRAPCRSKNR